MDMRSILSNAMEEKQLVSIFTNPSNTAAFSLGYILGMDDENILVSHISPSGKYDGYIILIIDKIFLVRQHTEYEKKIKTLYEFKNQYHEKIISGDECVFTNLLHYAKTKKNVVTIQLVGSEYDDVQGFVEEVEQSFVKLKNIDKFGNRNGESYMYIEDISFMVCDSVDEKVIKQLYLINNSDNKEIN